MASSVKRILCYGDSLTAGFWARGQKFEPYAKTLKKELESLGIIVEIDHHGFSGWTTEELLARSDYNKLEDFTGHKGPGLKKALTSQNYDLLILMAGTNDLSNKSDTFIFNNLKKLTEIAISAKIPTLNVGIPDSAYLFRDGHARSKRDSVNKMLSNFANSEKKLDWPPLISYTPCPFAFTPDSKFFDFDGLHFSEKGYQEFGKGICDVVYKLVK